MWIALSKDISNKKIEGGNFIIIIFLFMFTLIAKLIYPAAATTLFLCRY